MDRREDVKNKGQNTMSQEIHQGREREREQAKAKSQHMERVVSRSSPPATKPKAKAKSGKVKDD
jgi:hypothetical protein